jgi:uncharacterized protein (UPF0332 family)
MNHQQAGLLADSNSRSSESMSALLFLKWPGGKRWAAPHIKHTGVRSLFNRHYVRTAKVPKELAQIYNDLFERRQEGDYMDFVDFEESQVRP